MFLMQEALDSLREKGVVITEDEFRGACLAILLHDVGHGPFSHALEHSLVRGVHHEEVSTLIMTRLNEEMNGMLDTAIEIFNDHHPTGFLHDLVSSQLDMDRMDYLRRDSFSRRVGEGDQLERIIRMLNARRTARRRGKGHLFHREVHHLPAPDVLAGLPAQDGAGRGMDDDGILDGRTLPLERTCGPPRPSGRSSTTTSTGPGSWPIPVLAAFCALDDNDGDVLHRLNHPDTVLSVSAAGCTRRLFKIELRDAPFDQGDIAEHIDPPAATSVDTDDAATSSTTASTTGPTARRPTGFRCCKTVRSAMSPRRQTTSTSVP